MQNSILIWATVISSLLAEAAIARPNGNSAVRVHVALCDLTGLTARQLEDLKAETGALFSIGAFDILWSDPQVSCSEEPPSNGKRYARAFIFDSLLPSIQTFFPVRKGRYVMAVTLGRGPGPVIHVSRSAVEKIATLPDGRVVSGVLARALGRVLAHELAHRFLETERHSEAGILKAVLTRDDLVYAPRDALALSQDRILATVYPDRVPVVR
jgi:hypothetical protein